MARRRQKEPEPLEDEVPEWLWGFSTKRWVEEHGGSLHGRFEAVMEWREKRDAWLGERGLVVQGMGGLSYEEFKRIEREEPHRILRRPRNQETPRG